MKILDQKSSIKFLLVGVVNTAVTYLSYAFMMWSGMSWQWASPVSYALGMLNSFLMNKYWTFKDQSKVSLRQVFMFVVVNFVSWGVSFVFLGLFIDVFSFNKILAQIPAMFMSLAVNYLGSRCFVFIRGTICNSH